MPSRTPIWIPNGVHCEDCYTRSRGAGEETISSNSEEPSDELCFGIDADNVVLTAIKKAEDSNALILRFYEWAGKHANVGIQLPKGITSATLTNLMETPEGAPLQVVDGDKINVPTGPYDIVTVRASYAPQL